MRQNLDSDIALSGGWSCLVSSLSLKRSERCDCAETEKKDGLMSCYKMPREVRKMFTAVSVVL